MGAAMDVAMDAKGEIVKGETRNEINSNGNASTQT